MAMGEFRFPGQEDNPLHLGKYKTVGVRAPTNISNNTSRVGLEPGTLRLRGERSAKKLRHPKRREKGTRNDASMIL